jgi:uncharacterized membrane protein SirB2
MSLADYYLPLRHVHLAAVAVSLGLFALRGAAVLAGRSWPMTPVVRWTSVAIDTVLLAAGATLWAMLGLHPVRDAWLGTKLVLLLAYIVLGSFALKYAPTRTAKAAFWVAALLCVAAMVAIARAHDAAGAWRAIGSVVVVFERVANRCNYDRGDVDDLEERDIAQATMRDGLVRQPPGSLITLRSSSAKACDSGAMARDFGCTMA